MNSSHSNFIENLKHLLPESEDKIVEMLNGKSFDFEKFLAQPQHEVQEVDVAMQLIAKACGSKRSARVRRLLNIIYKYESTFLTSHALKVVGQVFDGDYSVKIPRLIECYAKIIDHMVGEEIPCTSTAWKIIPNLQNLINHLECSRMNMMAVKRAIKTLEKKCIEFDAPPDSLDPEEKFRELSVLPQSKDIASVPYLRANIIDGKYRDVEDYLDIHFKLLREDMVATFRDIIEQYKQNASNKTLNVQKNLLISFPPEYTVDGVQHAVSFPCSASINWESTKLLLPGSIVCISSDSYCNDIQFATIMKRTPTIGYGGQCKLNLVFEDSEHNVEHAKKYCLFETTAYFEGYKHFLCALKRLNNVNFPLADCIVHLNFDDIVPEYLMEKDIEFCLHEKCDSPNVKCEDSCKSFNVLNLQNWPTCEELHLDPYQYSAFQAALTQKLAVIQGPPGTGKTFLGVKIVKTLLQNTSKLPIIICCVTNHALDQFLKRLLPYTKKIVRLGGQGSLDELLPHKLGNLKGAIFRLRSEGEGAFSVNSKCQTSETLLKESAAIVNMLAPGIWECKPTPMFDDSFYSLKDQCKEINHLTSLYEFCLQKYFDDTALNFILSSDFKDNLCKGYKISGKLAISMLEWLNIKDEKNPYDTCKKKLSSLGNHIKNSSIKDLESKCYQNIWAISLEKRHVLFNFWREMGLQHLKEKIQKVKASYFKLLEQRAPGFDYDSFELLQNADIIGVTMTGAAKFYNLLYLCKPAIMVVEEAAEALECHLVSSIVHTVKHLILIGDHKQLRPIPSTHILGRDFNFSISLFERLFNNGAPSSTLITQHRMRPCIAELLVPTIYTQLESHLTVHKYEPIIGTNKNVFFINHSHLDNNSTVSSISNKFEASFIIYLASYFLNLGYKKSQITIIAMYNAQIQLIKNIASEREIDVYVTTVDNYQGEENDIMLVSFVRSNECNSIGFLKESNRVCVALSRARKGLYCIGNFSMYARVNDLFRDLKVKLENQQMIGTAFPLQCLMHKKVICASEDSAFIDFLKNGCRDLCDCLLPCGHKCKKVCHSSDLEHANYKCLEHCDRTIVDPDSPSMVRACSKLCWQACESKKKKIKLACGHHVSVDWKSDSCMSFLKCQRKVDRVLSCNHLISVLCSEVPEQSMCKKLIPVKLNCGHKKFISCGSKEKCIETHCEELELCYSPCGHMVEVPCSVVADEEFLISHCKKACSSLLDCGHPCVGLCSECKELGIHSSCAYRCELILSCGHTCAGTCGVPCPPCDKECFLSCFHKKCTNPCGKSCVECIEPCMRRCIHQTCSLPCYMICDVPPCQSECTVNLSCGHQCVGLCGDPCPPLCRVCDSELLVSKNVNDYFVLLQDCDHVIEVKQLTQCVEESVSAFEWPCCPKCEEKITKSLRYSDQLKKCKQHLIDSYDIQEEKLTAEYRFHTLFGLNNVAPWRFDGIKKKIQFIFDNSKLSESTLTILNVMLINLVKLVRLEENLDSDPKMESKLETLNTWIYQHLDKASYQQFHELEDAVSLLEKLFNV